MLLFMGVALEKSGIAREMLNCLHLLFLRVPGSLAVCVTIIGILLVPSAGLVGASVGTLTLVALPTMLAQRYPVPVSTSAVAAGGTLGLILPPGLMLIFLADQMGVTVGEMFLSTWSRGEARWLGPYGHHSVSSPRSSNRTCGFPASGFPTGFTSKHTAVGQDGPDFVGSHRAPRTRPYRGNLVPRDDTLWRLTRK